MDRKFVEDSKKRRVDRTMDWRRGNSLRHLAKTLLLVIPVE